MIAVGRARIDEMTRLMAATVPRMGRPPTAPESDSARDRFRCAERRLRGELSEAEAARVYRVSARTVERWVAWCLAPANDDPRADRCRALAGRRG
jgi:hypothetical protein